MKGECELNLNTQYVITITCFLTFDNLNVSLAKMFELTLGLNGPLYVRRRTSLRPIMFSVSSQVALMASKGSGPSTWEEDLARTSAEAVEVVTLHGYGSPLAKVWKVPPGAANVFQRWSGPLG